VRDDRVVDGASMGPLNVNVALLVVVAVTVWVHVKVAVPPAGM